MVRLGEWDQRTGQDCVQDQGCNDPPVDISVEEAIAHEDYLPRGNPRGNRHHDIALVRLSRPVSQYTGNSSEASRSHL